MVQISNGIRNLFEISTNGRHFVKNHLKSGHKALDFEGSGFQMVGTYGDSSRQPLKTSLLCYFGKIHGSSGN